MKVSNDVIRSYFVELWRDAIFIGCFIILRRLIAERISKMAGASTEQSIGE
jgi:hypothetical protein